MTPYYRDELITLYHGDCREVTEWLAADVLVTDPPYGRAWRQGRLSTPNRADDSRSGIAGDTDTGVRDAVLDMWRPRPAAVFGDLMLCPPAGTKLTGAYLKPVDAGVRGAIGGFRRDLEAVYLIGKWSSGIGGRSSLLATAARLVGSPCGLAVRGGHPHAKPLDVMETLIAHCPPGVIADPFAGGGATLIAARNAGRSAVGVELEEKYCEAIARRLDQGILHLGIDRG